MAKALIGSAGKHLAIAALLLLAACASESPAPTQSRYSQLLIDFSQRPHDWPELEIDVRVVRPEQLAAHCLPVPAGYAVGGCAYPYFCQRRCTIWLGDYQMPEHEKNLLIGHERAHCRGYDHPGSTVLRELWERAKAQGCDRSTL